MVALKSQDSSGHVDLHSRQLHTSILASECLKKTTAEGDTEQDTAESHPQLAQSEISVQQKQESSLSSTNTVRNLSIRFARQGRRVVACLEKLHLTLQASQRLIRPMVVGRDLLTPLLSAGNISRPGARLSQVPGHRRVHCGAGTGAVATSGAARASARSSLGSGRTAGRATAASGLGSYEHLSSDWSWGLVFLLLVVGWEEDIVAFGRWKGWCFVSKGSASRKPMMARVEVSRVLWVPAT